jgi:hypothetical protein
LAVSTVTELNPRLLALTEAGVSVWLDQIRRSMVEGGGVAGDDELRALLADARPPRYLSILGYLPPSDALDEAVGGLRQGFLQLSSTPRRDADIPGAGYSFGTLMAAQSAGDLETLRSHGLAAERVEVEGDPAEGVRALTERITAILQEN